MAYNIYFFPHSIASLSISAYSQPLLGSLKERDPIDKKQNKNSSVTEKAAVCANNASSDKNVEQVSLDAKETEIQ